VEIEFFLSKPVAEPEVIPQGFDPKLYGQLPPAAVMPALLSPGTQFCTHVSAPSSPSCHSRQSKDSRAQSVSGSTADALPGLHPQATLRNSLLDLTSYKFTSSSGPGISPAAPCWWEGAVSGTTAFLQPLPGRGISLPLLT